MELRQGQGDATEFKQRGLTAAFYVGLKIFAARFGYTHYRYHHFDLNSGDGFNEQAGCIGSPVAFLRAAAAAQCEKFAATFIDIAPATVATLRDRLDDQRCGVEQADNRDFIARIPDIIRARQEDPRLAIGSVLSDPNGTQVPLDELLWLCGACPKLDLVIHWNSASVKRCRSVFGEEHQVRLSEAVEQFKDAGKRHWLIRRPVTPWQFTLLVGRGVHTNEHRSLSLYHLDSQTGADILQRCSYTEAERAAMVQRTLF